MTIGYKYKKDITMIFGLGESKKKPVKKSDGYTKSKNVTSKTPQTSREKEATAILKKMQAKKDSDSCPFC